MSSPYVEGAPHVRLEGFYYVQTSAGTLELNCQSDPPELWLRNDLLCVRLVPSGVEISRQLCLPFDLSETDLHELSVYYSALLARTFALIRTFSVEQHAMVIFCLDFGDAALDLLSSCPALGFMVACTNFYAYPERLGDGKARLDPQEKRTSLLKKMDFPAAPFVVKVLRKIRPAACSWPLLYDLRRLLLQQHPKITKALCHARQITPLLLQTLAISNLLPYLKSSVLDELVVCGSDGGGSVDGDMAKVVERAERDIERALYWGIPIPRFRNVNDLKGFHAYVDLYLISPQAYKDFAKYVFPDPPLPGISFPDMNAFIRPLLNGQELWLVCNAMNVDFEHYAPKISQGENNYSAYHIELDTQKAILILKNKDLNFILGSSRKLVSREMLDLVDDWLAGRIKGEELTPETNIWTKDHEGETDA